MLHTLSLFGVYMLFFRLLEDKKVETSRLKDQVEKLSKTIRDSEEKITTEREKSINMSLQLQKITKEKEDLLIRYILICAFFTVLFFKNSLLKLLLRYSCLIHILH